MNSSLLSKPPAAEAVDSRPDSRRSSANRGRQVLGIGALLLVSLASAATGRAASGPAQPEPTDPTLATLEAELERARALRMQKLDTPYYLAAYSLEEERLEISAAFGALVDVERGRRRRVGVDLRVGSPALDNSNYADADAPFGRSGIGTPLDADPDALRHALWLLFDERYKRAAEAIARKRAFLQTHEVESRPADFSPAPTTKLVLPRAELSVDSDRWTRIAKKASALFRSRRGVHDSLVRLRAVVGHQSFVNSDGARHRFAIPTVELLVGAETQAADGMRLESVWETVGRTERDLPDEEQVLRAAAAVADRLEALAKAPALNEDYSGPVLFTGRAAAAFFVASLGSPLSRPRERLGAPRNGRLTERLGKHVATKRLTARDDPTQTEWRGLPLLGHFPVDDDGVAPTPITLVRDGVLESYYMSRVPTRRLTTSNGHSRDGEGGIGNLFIETSQPVAGDALVARLLELAHEEDCDYGLLIEELDSSFDGGWGPDEGLQLPDPTVAWRIDRKGRRELVRGLRFKPVSQRVLKDIDALGDDPALLNTTRRGNRISVVAPSVLVKLLEVQRARDDQEKPPAVARPLP